MTGFKKFESAQRTLTGIEIESIIKKIKLLILALSRSKHSVR